MRLSRQHLLVALSASSDRRPPSANEKEKYTRSTCSKGRMETYRHTNTIPCGQPSSHSAPPQNKPRRDFKSQNPFYPSRVRMASSRHPSRPQQQQKQDKTRGGRNPIENQSGRRHTPGIQAGAIFLWTDNRVAGGGWAQQQSKAAQDLLGYDTSALLAHTAHTHTRRVKSTHSEPKAIRERGTCQQHREEQKQLSSDHVDHPFPLRPI